MCENLDKYSVVLKNVSKSFDDEMIFKSVDLELEKGKFYTAFGTFGLWENYNFKSYCWIFGCKFWRDLY